jgi:PEP-CTERM motif
MRHAYWLSCCLAGGIALAVADPARAAKVWESTFDSSADGVVDIYNNNTGKVMIGPASGGRLQIEAWDNGTNAYTPDKVGRPLGATLGYNSTMSGQYKFNWSALPTAVAGQEAYELIGFLGDSASPQTRQVFGTIMRHWKVGNDYYVALDAAAMGAGFTDFGYRQGTGVNLGPNALANNYDLRIEYDGSGHVLGISLRDIGGSVVASQTADLDTDLGGWHNYGVANFNNETNSIALTHLGWEDYTGWAGDKKMIWQVDSLAYYNTSTVPEPSTLLLAMLPIIGLTTWRGRRKNG